MVMDERHEAIFFCDYKVLGIFHEHIAKIVMEIFGLLNIPFK